MQGHPEVGHPLVEVTAVGLVPLLPPNQPPEERDRRIEEVPTRSPCRRFMENTVTVLKLHGKPTYGKGALADLFDE